MKDYKNNHRTNHDDIPPPIERIRGLRRKVLHFENPASVFAKTVHRRSITLIDSKISYSTKKKEELIV